MLQDGGKSVCILDFRSNFHSHIRGVIAYALKLAISKNQPEAKARVYMCECLNSVSTLYCLMYRRPNSFCYNIQYPALNEAFSTLSAFSDTNKEGILNEECLCTYCQEPSNCNLIIQTFSHTLTLLTLLNGSIQETSSCYNYAIHQVGQQKAGSMLLC